MCHRAAFKMAVAPSKLPFRKQPDHSRSRKLIFGYPMGASTALIATSFTVLLFCSLFFLDLEMIYRKTGLVTQPADPVIPSQPASSAPHDQIEDPNRAIPLTTPAVEITTTDTDNLPETQTEPEIEVLEGPEELGDGVAILEDIVDVPSEEAEVVPKVIEENVEMQPPSEEEKEMVSKSHIIAMPKESRRSLQGCNITQGRWVFDNVSYPLYRTKNCPFADPGFRCEDNGRPDKEFMSYHWQPHDCDLPR